MFSTSIFSTAVIYSLLGLMIGVSVAALFFYSMTYSKIKHKNYQLRDACLLYQKQLAQLLNKNKALEIQVREVKQRWEKDQQGNTEGGNLTANSARQQQETQQLQAELNQLQQEKRVLEDSLKQSNDRWKRERDQLQSANAELEKQVETLRAQTEQSETGDELNAEQQTDWQNKLKGQQAAWKRAQTILHKQIAGLQTARKALEAELMSQVNQTEREKQALEEEIELLTDRMMRLQLEQEELAQQTPQNAAVNAVS